jgi:hypothetical protein
MRRPAGFFTPIILCTLLLFGNCGIYTIRRPLDPPYSLSLGADSLYFYGLNTEAYALGYILWYKERQGDTYRTCAYQDPSNFPRPTVPRDSDTETVKYTIYLKELFPDDDIKSFYELNFIDPTRKFYFAVSTYGEEGEESAREEFGIWPN